MRMFKQVFPLLVFESVNLGVHAFVRPFVTYGWLADTVSWLITIAIAVYAGWAISKRIDSTKLLTLKVCALLWLTVLIIPILIYALEMLLGSLSGEELRELIYGYSIASIPTFLVLYCLVLFGRWLDRRST